MVAVSGCAEDSDDLSIIGRDRFGKIEYLHKRILGKSKVYDYIEILTFFDQLTATGCQLRRFQVRNNLFNPFPFVPKILFINYFVCI